MSYLGVAYQFTGIFLCRESFQYLRSFLDHGPDDSGILFASRDIGMITLDELVVFLLEDRDVRTSQV